MTIRLSKEIEQQATASIQRFFSEHLEQDIGDLKASLLLDFFLRELGPSAYNRGVADAQTRMQGHVADLDGTCHEPEFTYWDKR